MAYNLAIDTPGGPQHPAFAYKTLEESLEAAEHAVSEGYVEMEGGIIICTGPGTALKIISDEHLKAGQPRDDKTYFLVVHICGGALPAMGFDSEKEAGDALAAALEDGAAYNGVLRHVAREGHEYNYVVLTTGAVIMRMDKAAYMEKQRRALEEQTRLREAAGPAGGLAGTMPPGKIFIPGQN